MHHDGVVKESVALCLQDKKSLAQKLDNLQGSLRDASKAAGALAAASASAGASPATSVASSTASGASAASSAGPGARALRQLQNRLEKAALKCNEAAAIRGTYEAVLTRLKQEGPRLEATIRTVQVAVTVLYCTVR